MCLSLRISGQLPAPIVNGREDSFWKWTDFQLWMARDLDLGSGHTAYRRASLIDLYLQANFHSNRKKTFCGRTNVRTDIWDRLYSVRVSLKTDKYPNKLINMHANGTNVLRQTATILQMYSAMYRSSIMTESYKPEAFPIIIGKLVGWLV